MRPTIVNPGERHACPKCDNTYVSPVGLTARPECWRHLTATPMRPAAQLAEQAA